jgi:ssDNA-binding Zn-finger/Zn-ribbon topoisomerase 1
MENQIILSVKIVEPTHQRASDKRIANHEMVGKDCPTGCGGTIRVVNGRYGEFLSCTNYKNKNCSFKPPSKKVAN